MRKTAITILKIFLPILSGVSLLITILLGYVFYERYTMDFNPEGRYFDGMAVYHEQSVAGYGVLLFFSLTLLVLLIVLVRKVFKT